MIAAALTRDMSGEWPEAIPAAWPFVRLKHLAVVQTGLTLGKDYGERHLVERPYLRVANVQDGYLDLDNITTVRVPAEDVNRHELRAGDVLMTEGGDFDKLGRGYVWEGQVEGCLHQNHVFAVRPDGRRLESHFLSHLMASAYGRAYFTSTSQQTTNLASTNSTKLGDFPVPLPSIAQQRSIVARLATKTADIDAVLAAKERMLGLLQEKRQALISRAVTRGLDAGVPMKDSGLLWVGQMPVHWKTAKLLHYASVFNGSTPSRIRDDYWDGDIPWLSSGKVNDYLIEVPSEWITDTALRECSLALVPKGAVVVGMVGQGRTRGMSARVGIEACINQNMAAIVPEPDLMSEFLHYVLIHGYEELREQGRGGNQEALNCEIVGAFRIPLPPFLEQEAICLHVRQETARLDKLASLNRDQVARLREYRQALISAAVTGKIDLTGEAFS